MLMPKRIDSFNGIPKRPLEIAVYRQNNGKNGVRLIFDAGYCTEEITFTEVSNIIFAKDEFTIPETLLIRVERNSKIGHYSIFHVIEEKSNLFSFLCEDIVVLPTPSSR